MVFGYRAWIAAAALLALLLSGCGLSLAEDIKPPPNYREPTIEELPADTSAAFPLVPPNPVQGESIYAEKCLPCHGATGMGDGPQASNLSNPASPLGSPALARSARPADWFEIVTKGNIERLMPGFSSLNDRQRWDVVAYAFTLSTTPDELALGQEIYGQSCAECHGPSGQGDGERAASLSTAPASWADQERLVGLSAEDMVGVMAGGQDHPSFTGVLNEEQQYAAAAYVRSLGFASPDQPVERAGADQPAEEEEQSAVEQPAVEQPAAELPTGEEVAESDQVIQSLTIHGQVSNGTPGGRLPAGIKVLITAYEGMSPAFEVAGDVSADGSYRVEDIAYNPNYVYFAQVEANGLIFNSDFLHGKDVTGAEVELPVLIYETTTDLSGLRADRLHIFFDFSEAGTVQVVNLFIVSNPGGDVVVAPAEDQPVIRYALPEGALNLQFQDGELGGRYIKTEDGFGDRLGVAPGSGQHQVLFAYTLPYDRKLTLDVPLPLPVDAAIVMVPPEGVTLKSDQLMNAGQRDVQGMAFEVYQTEGALPAGGKLSMSLSGRASSTAAQPGSVNSLILSAGIFGAVLIGAGIWLYRQQAGQKVADDEPVETPAEVASESSEALLDAIVALDDLHASGSLPEAAYQERRAELKARLAEALEHEQAD